MTEGESKTMPFFDPSLKEVTTIAFWIFALGSIFWAVIKIFFQNQFDEAGGLGG